MKATSNSTSNSVSTFKRLLLIGIQIRNIFDELTDENERTKDKYIKAIEKQYINSFTFYAMKSGKSYAELTVKIDWNEYQKQLGIGKTVITTKYPNGVLHPTKNIVTRYRDYVQNNGFSIEWCFTYADNIDIQKARKELGSVPAKKKIKAEDTLDMSEMIFELEELPEMSYKLSI